MCSDKGKGVYIENMRLSWTYLKEINTCNCIPFKIRGLASNLRAPLVRTGLPEEKAINLHGSKNSRLQRRTEGLLNQYKISHSNGTDCNGRLAQYHHHVLQITSIN